MDGGARGERGARPRGSLHGGPHTAGRPPRASARCSGWSRRRSVPGTPPSTRASAARCGTPVPPGAIARRLSAGGSSRAPRPPPGARAPARRARAIRSVAGRRRPSSFPTYAINAVMLPTGRVLFCGGAARPRDADAHQRHACLRLGPRQGDRRLHRGAAAEDRRQREGGGGAPVLLRAVAAAERRGARHGRDARLPVFSGNTQVSDFKGLNRAFTFDPWALKKWTEQPRDAQGPLVSHPGDAPRRAHRRRRGVGRVGHADRQPRPRGLHALRGPRTWRAR